MDWKIELIILPVSDVDRAKAFYVDKIGFHPDYDVQVSDSVRFVQLTPPGSACSIAIGTGLTEATPGSVEGIQVVVDDADAAHEMLSGRGVECSDVTELEWGRFVYFYFADPDGNRWSVQQVPGEPT